MVDGVAEKHNAAFQVYTLESSYLSHSNPLYSSSYSVPSRLRHRNGRIVGHRLAIGLCTHRLALLRHLAHELEIINIKRRRVCTEDFGCPRSNVREGVRAASWDDDIVAWMGVDRVLAGDMEPHHALHDEERLVVHFVPVRGRPTCAFWDYYLCSTEAHVCRRE